MKQNIYDDEVFFKEYTSVRKSGATYNDFIEQPAIKSLMPALEGKSVLDLGCGSGQFARYCVDRGAVKVLGVDISKKMLELAKTENNDEKIKYLCSPIEDLELSNQTYHVIVSSLAIHYIKDYTSLIKNIAELLAKDGEFIFSTEHPIVTARKEMDNWVKNEEGNKLHWAFDHYQEEGQREQSWHIDGVIKYHRTISTLVNTLILNGLTIESIVEPQSTAAGLEQMPKLVNERRRPSFLLIKARKGSL